MKVSSFAIKARVLNRQASRSDRQLCTLRGIMKPTKTLLRRSAGPILVSACLLGLGIGGVTRSSQNGTATQGKAPRIQNKTRSFEVIQTGAGIGSNGIVELSLRNGYEKNITAYAVSVNGLISTQDFRYSDGDDQVGIAPEAVYATHAGVARSRKLEGAAQQALDIIVLAVVFDDKTTDGDPRLVAELLDTRQGSKIQLMRVIGLVNKALRSAATIDDAAFEKLRSEISSLPIESQNSTAESSRLRGERDSALWRLNQITAASDSRNAKERMIRFKEACESLAARL